MHIHIIDHNTTHRNLIASLVTDAFPGVVMLTFAKTHDDHEDYITSADLVIISGGTWLVHKNPNTHRRIIKRIIDENKPIFGICLGGEALADYFGASLVRLEGRIRGVHAVRIVDQKLQDSLGCSSLPVYQHHIWAIQSPPETLRVLAESDSGVELFKHTGLPIWGSQFHPEVRRGSNFGYLAFSHVISELGFETNHLGTLDGAVQEKIIQKQERGHYV